MTLVQRQAATVEECAEALRQLADGELRQLERVARIRVIGLAALDWQDLLHDAIGRMLEGRRRWPRDVSLIVFLRETMRSIASEQWRRLEMPLVVAESEVARAAGVAGDSAVDNTSDVSMEPEARTSAAETLARIEVLFEQDKDALQVMEGMASGKSPAEIQEETGMNATRYASTRRRIRRRLLREFSEGEG